MTWNAKKAMLLLTDMRKHGVNPDVIHYGIVIEVLCHVGRMEDVMSQLKQMIHEGAHPNSLYYAYLVQGFIEFFSFRFEYASQLYKVTDWRTCA
jgi:pentatricopeptide repeat protein